MRTTRAAVGRVKEENMPPLRQTPGKPSGSLKNELEGAVIVASATQFIKARMGLIVWPAVIVLLALGGWMGWKTYVRRNNANAFTLYDRAMAQEDREVVPGLKRLVQDYPDTKASRLAWMRIGHAYYREGKADLAADAYQNCIRNMPKDHELAPTLFLSLAYCYEIKGDYAKAIRYCEQVQGGAGTVSGLSYALSGRLYEKMMEPDRAVDAYRKALSADVAEGPYRSMIEWRIAQFATGSGKM